MVIRMACVFAALFASLLFPSKAIAQSIPLTVQAGTALDIAPKKPVRVKRAGSEVLGHVASVEHISKRRRALAFANGDFTPFRRANVEFDTLVLPDGSKLPLQTAVSQGVPDVVHLTVGGNEKKKGRVSQTVSQEEQTAKDQADRAIDELKAPGKWS